MREQVRLLVPYARPPATPDRQLRGTALVRFHLDGFGYAHDVQLVRSSGHRALDATVAHIVSLAGPYPPVEGWVTIPVEF